VETVPDGRAQGLQRKLAGVLFSIETVTAPVTAHESEAALPEATETGAARKLTITGGVTD
jgi:hypothetical protein